MASSKKELCPQCETNQKGVSAKTCKQCSMSNLRNAKNTANQPKNDIPTKVKVGTTTDDKKYYL